MDELEGQQQFNSDDKIAFLNGGGEMGALMREYDWWSTTLGSPTSWPIPLQTAVQLMLNTKHAMYVFWGNNSICMYNDAYSQSIGPELHPLSLGQPGKKVWAEIWDEIGPQIDQVMAGGNATWHENQLLPITRNGQREDIYWTYSYSPIGDNSAPNGVGGVLVRCTETTGQVLAEQRFAAQASLQLRLFEKAPGIIAISRGPDHVFEFANEAYHSLVNNRELIGRTVAEAVPESGKQGLIKLLDTVYTTGERFVASRIPTLLECGDDGRLEEYILDFIFEPIRDEEGGVTGIFLEGHDVTSRQRAEDERRQIDELNRRLVEGIKGYAVFTTDATGVIVDWTAGAEDIFGWKAEDIVGQGAEILFTPEDRANDVPKTELATAAKNGCAEDTRWHIRRDGSLFFANGSVRPLHDAQGEISGFVKMARDETARQQAEARLLASETQLALSEESLRLSTDAADIGTWDLDLATNILNWSDRTKAMFGILPDVSCSMDDFYAGLHPDDVAATTKAFAAAIDPAERAIYNVEYRTIGKEDRVVRWISAKGKGLFDDNGNCIRAIGTAIDITQQKIDENALAISNARFRFLDILANAIQLESDPEAVMTASTRLLGEHLGVDICPYADVEADGDTFHIRSDWTSPGTPSIVGSYRLNDFGRVAAEAQRNGNPLVIRNAIADLGEEEAATFTSIGIAATICLPLVKHGRLAAMMAVHSARPRDWSDEEVALVGEVAERCWAHVERVGANAALRESEARFQKIADSAPVPMWVTRLDRKRSFVNRAYVDFLGLDYDTAIDFDWRQVLAPEDEARIVAESIAGEASLKPFVLEGRYRRADGEWRWIQSESQPRWGSDGAHIGFIGVAHDVTESREAESILRESERRFRDQFENANDFIFTTDLDMRITSCNPSIAQALERRPEDLIGKSISEFVPPETWARNQELLKAKLSGDGDATQYEIGVFDSRGEIKTWEINSRLTRDHVGAPTGLHAIGRDVTERILSQQMLKEAHDRAEADAAEQAAILGQLAEGVIITDAEGRITFVNNAATLLHGVAALDVEPADYSETYHLFREDGSPYPFEQLPLARAVVNGETVIDARWRIRRPDGTEVLAIGNAQPVLGQSGDAIGAVLTVRDDTARHAAELALRELNETLEERVVRRTAELEQTQEALRQSQKLEAMGQLTGGVAHDFNNLLTPILGSLDMLHRKGLGDARQQRLIDGALQSAERAKLLVQRLLAFARRQPLKPSAVDVDELIAGMADLIASTSGPNIKVALDLGNNAPAALADANQLEMALLNLSVNGRDAMPDGGTLTLACMPMTVETGNAEHLPSGRYVRISVADTGVGMDEATVARAIEPFFSTKGIGQGTGLGLSMVHGLASQLGGALTISSRRDLGTSVALWLPASEVAAEAAAESGVAAEKAEVAATILLVDDEELVRISTADMLTDLGYNVIEAESAAEALDILSRGQKFHLLVTDHLMPGMTGVDLARIVSGRQPDILVLIVSGYAEVGDIPQNLPRLTKPFRQADLAASVAEMLETARDA